MARVEFVCVSRVRDASARFCLGSFAILAGVGTTASKSGQKRTNAPTIRNVLVCTDDRFRKRDRELGKKVIKKTLRLDNEELLKLLVAIVKTSREGTRAS